MNDIDQSVLGTGERLFQIYENHLRTLEQAIPLLTENIPYELLVQRPDLAEWMEIVKKIISDVRWNYRPVSSEDYGETESHT